MLLAKADVAMSVARQQGGNRLLVYDDAYGEQLRGDFELQSALATVLDRNELVLHYQPIIDTRYNRVVGVEALMRWIRGSQILSPGKFIPLAEDSGLDFRMGEWAISEALQQLRRRQQMMPDRKPLIVATVPMTENQMVRSVQSMAVSRKR